MCSMVVKLAGACSVRTRHSSSRKTMPITQCNLFSTDGGSQLACRPRQRGDVEACLALDFIADFARALDHDHPFQSGPIVAFRQPRNIVDCRVGSGFDAAVIALDGLVSTDGCIFESRCGSARRRKSRYPGAVSLDCL